MEFRVRYKIDTKVVLRTIYIYKMEPDNEKPAKFSKVNKLIFVTRKEKQINNQNK